VGSWKSLKIDSGTGWKGIYRDAGSGWKALTWEGVAVDVGGACIDRASNTQVIRTRIDKNNPANTSGTLTNICLYVSTTAGTDWYVGIFYVVTENTLKCRSAANLGALSVGENNKNVSLSVVSGDYIGMFSDHTSERIEGVVSGSGLWYGDVSANHCVVDDQTAYTSLGGWTLSCYGTG
jgi:hypothetical protein